MVIPAIKIALENMDKKYCKLSQIDYRRIELGRPWVELLAEEKHLERPFAYEFYHQLRKLMDSGKVDFGGPIIQAEVNKRYQHCFEKGKIPDFIIHVPNTKMNLIVVEFKLASNLRNIEGDFKKLVEFKKVLKYQYLIQVIIGNSNSLGSARQRIKQLSSLNREKIIIMEFNLDSWKVESWEIEYRI